MNIHHNNCCHPLDKKSAVPANRGRSSKSNVGDTNKIYETKFDLGYCQEEPYTFKVFIMSLNWAKNIQLFHTI